MWEYREKKGQTTGLISCSVGQSAKSLARSDAPIISWDIRGQIAWFIETGTGHALDFIIWNIIIIQRLNLEMLYFLRHLNEYHNVIRIADFPYHFVGTLLGVHFLYLLFDSQWLF